MDHVQAVIIRRAGDIRNPRVRLGRVGVIRCVSEEDIATRIEHVRRVDGTAINLRLDSIGRLTTK